MSSTPIERLRRMVDGVGHLGGGIGVLIIAPQIPNMSVLGAMLLVSGFLVAADARWRRREPPRSGLPCAECMAAGTGHPPVVRRNH